jgi:transketolase
MSAVSGPLADLKLFADSVRAVDAAGDALTEEALALRRDIVDALYCSGGGHYGGCLSALDLILALYRCELRVSPKAPLDPDRDRFILSKGHAALALYAVLRRLGFYASDLNHYAEFTSPLEGHPDMASVPGVDFSTGSLGQGLSVGLGMAYALRRRSRRVWVMLGDGECQEGQVWEAAMLAASCKADNLHAIVDSNLYQEWGHPKTEDEPNPTPVSQITEKWRSFGWKVVNCDGHDFGDIRSAFRAVTQVTGQPSIIVAKTVKGRGVPLIEAHPQRFHCDAVTAAEHSAIVASLTAK